MRRVNRRQLLAMNLGILAAGFGGGGWTGGNSTSGFRNPLTGQQGSLVRQQIKSPNFSPGSAGWIIKQDGSAEFNNVTIRGATSIGTTELQYSPTPALGNLVFSSSATSGTDSFGNEFIGGDVAYGSAPGIQFAAQFGFFGISFYTAPGPGGPWSPSPSKINYTWNPTALNFDALIEAHQLGLVTNQPIGVNVDGAISELTTVNTGSGSGRLAEESPNGIVTALDESVTGSGKNSGNVTSPTLITSAYATDSTNGAEAGTTYSLKTWFNGVWGNNVMTVYADIGGSSTALCTIGGALGASGDTVNGWMELEVYVVSSSTCRASVGGVIRDSTTGANILPSNTAGISSTAVTGIPFAAGDSIGISIAFTTSVSGQTITTQAERFTRYA